MNSFQFNKYAMALLGTVFVVFGLNLISEAIFHTNAPEERAFVIAADTDPGIGGAADGADSGPIYEPIGPLLVNADEEAGQKVYKKCAACHTVDNGGANKVGPNLWNIVNRPVASHDGFSYSSALKEFGDGKNWSYEDLNGFLWKPKKFIKGTAMGFAGLSKVQDRANVILYLRSIADSPAPLPDAASAAVSETEEPATEMAPEGATEAEAPAAEMKPADAMEEKPADTMEEKPADSGQAN